jgi:hypothetical protein
MQLGTGLSVLHDSLNNEPSDLFMEWQVVGGGGGSLSSESVKVITVQASGWLPWWTTKGSSCLKVRVDPSVSFKCMLLFWEFILWW